MLKDLGDAKIDDHDAAVMPQHEVAGLDVAIDDRRRVAMQIGQDVTNLDAPIGHIFLSNGLPILLQQIFQGFAFDEFHDQVTALAFGEKVKDLGDRCVGQCGQDIGFALKVLNTESPESGIGSDVAHLFDGHDLLNCRKAQISRLIHGAHPPHTMDADNLVAILQDGLARQCPFRLEGNRSVF